MTDKEIIKAFECCKKVEEEGRLKYCLGCLVSFMDEDTCKINLFSAVLDLIKRQQAENEDLKEQLKEHNSFPHFTKDTQFVSVSRKADGQFTADKMIQVEVDKIRAEAIKEFAEGLKEYQSKNYLYSCEDCGWVPISDEVFDNLVKEMTEGSNGE